MPRYDAPEPFVGAFVEYSDAWSVGQHNRFLSLRGAAFVEILASKVTACNLPCAEGENITEPADITLEALDRMDKRAFQWFLDTASDCARIIGELGEASRLPSFAIIAAAGEDHPPT